MKRFYIVYIVIITGFAHFSKLWYLSFTLLLLSVSKRFCRGQKQLIAIYKEDIFERIFQINDGLVPFACPPRPQSSRRH